MARWQHFVGSLPAVPHKQKLGRQIRVRRDSVEAATDRNRNGHTVGLANVNTAH
jgi:hypothetical protein